MPGVAQVWLTQEELSALILAATKKGTRLSPRMEESIVPKLDTARSYLGCPVPARKENDSDQDGRQAHHRVDAAPGSEARGAQGGLDAFEGAVFGLASR